MHLSGKVPTQHNKGLGFDPQHNKNKASYIITMFGVKAL